jgi:D-sedoheptulose 7-phosphate isomerase
VFGLGNSCDTLLAISTSGNSQNIIYAAQAAKAKGMSVIGLTGENGGRLKALSDECICVPETETYKIQELHLPVYHAICLAVEEEFFGKSS